MFGINEISRFLGKPVHLIRFDIGPLSFAFTSSDTPDELEGLTYVPSGITRSAIAETSEVAKNRVKITIPIALDPSEPNPPPTQEFASLWRPYPPAGIVRVTCIEKHRGDSDAVVAWVGRVVQPEFTDTLLTLTCDNSRARNRAAGGGHRCQRACDLVLYRQGLGECNLDPDLYAIPSTLTAAAGLTVTADEFATSSLSLAGGLLKWTRADGLVEQRTIMRHPTPDTVVLDYGALDLAPGLEVIAWPGCEHTYDACDARDNTDNYGGWYYLPNKNPWNGTPP